MAGSAGDTHIALQSASGNGPSAHILQAPATGPAVQRKVFVPAGQLVGEAQVGIEISVWQPVRAQRRPLMVFGATLSTRGSMEAASSFQEVLARTGMGKLMEATHTG